MGQQQSRLFHLDGILDGLVAMMNLVHCWQEVAPSWWGQRLFRQIVVEREEFSGVLRPEILHVTRNFWTGQLNSSGFELRRLVFCLLWIEPSF